MSKKSASLKRAGAPEAKIEITPEMIEAGLTYLHDAGFPALTVRAEDPDFVEDFLRAIIEAG